MSILLHTCIIVKNYINIIRVKDAMDKDIPLFNGIDNGTWYNLKRSKLNNNDQRQNVSFFPINGWANFPSAEKPPSFSYGSIYNHFIESAKCIEEKENIDPNNIDENENVHGFGTAKPLSRGRIYFASGHVQDLNDCVSSTGDYCIKAEVLASCISCFSNDR